jgi:hypothetical protein
LFFTGFAKKKEVIYELLGRFVGVCEKNMWQ